MWNNSAKAAHAAAQANQARPAKVFVRTKWTTIGLVVGVIGSSLARTGLPKPEQPASSAGSAARTVGAIDGTVRSVAQGVQEVSSSVRDQFDRAQSMPHDESLRGRVEATLSDSESLNSKKVAVAVDDEGVVALKGEVATASAKEQAVALAREVKGVVRVEDHLAVTPKLRVFESASSGGRKATIAR